MWKHKGTCIPCCCHGASLFYFAAGQKESVRIPLHFDVTGLAEKGMRETDLPPKSNGVAYPYAPGQFTVIYSTPHGIIVPCSGSTGFWIIPWSEVDSYRAATSTHAPATPPK